MVIDITVVVMIENSQRAVVGVAQGTAIEVFFKNRHIS